MNREIGIRRRDPSAVEDPTKPDEERLPSRGGVDVPFLFIAVALIAFGCVMVYSASSVYAEQYHGDSTYFIKRHLIFLMLGVALTAIVVRLATLKLWRDLGLLLYPFAILLLLAVLAIGTDLGSGAKRWLDLKVFTLQPSEIAKTALVLALARYFSKYWEKVTSPYRFGGGFRYGVFYPAILIGIIGVLVVAEHHVSGLLIIGAIGVSMMFLGGTNLRWILPLGVVIALGALVMILFFPYASARVTTWLHLEEADPLGPAWQTLQGLMAIGSGGLFGTGLGNSRQKFGYVSQPQNDFIFTIICEELGFVGAALVIGLFTALVVRGFRIARNAPDSFCSLVVYGLTFKVALQVILNLAVVTNSVPNTGISLPFFSYGGTSLILQVFEVGIILSISRYCSCKKI